jgi:hypothetical protein
MLHRHGGSDRPVAQQHGVRPDAQQLAHAQRSAGMLMPCCYSVPGSSCFNVRSGALHQLQDGGVRTAMDTQNS